VQAIAGDGAKWIGRPIVVDTVHRDANAGIEIRFGDRSSGRITTMKFVG